MYPTLRSLHLLLGLFGAAFLLMYGVSAVQMAHNSWFNMRPAVKTQTVQLAGGRDDARELARQLISEHQLRGELGDIKKSDSGLRFRLVIPGTVNEVTYTHATGAATIKTSTGGFMVMLNRLHHAAGMWHELPVMKAWAAGVALISAVLILIGCTGLYLWFARRQDRVIGIILLTANLVFAITVLVLIRSAGP